MSDAIEIAVKPTLEQVREAAAKMRNVVIHTPLVPLRRSDRYPDILLKPEIHQAVDSFKLRGVYNAAASMTDKERQRGLSTVSAGNTAQAVAWCGRYFGVPARSVMPDNAPQTKIEAVEAFGATPVLVPSDELFRYMREHGWEQETYSFIHPWTDARVMTGHGSMALEIFQDCPDVETVFVPVGGGGLIAGVASTLKQLNPGIRIVAVEPDECCALYASFRSKRAVAWPCQTMSDGVAVPYLTPEMYPLLREVVDEVALVSEYDTMQAIRQLAIENKMVVEGAGALATAAAMAYPAEGRGLSVAIVTGGGIDIDKFITIMQS
ncbi:threonine ammonia-lyase [soil metagenome]